jgi:hypothetical protein
MILSTSLRPHELTVETDIIAIGEISHCLVALLTAPLPLRSILTFALLTI